MSEQVDAVITTTRRPTVPSHQVPQVTQVINNEGKIRFFLNDPTTPDLIAEVPVPTNAPDPVFSVQNYVGFHPDPNSNQSKAGHVHVALMSAQDMLRKYLGTNPRWAAAQVLNVYPLAGVDFNAFYDRRSLKFFADTSPLSGLAVYTCLSNDVVTHEWGHSVLDSLRPDLWNSPLTEHTAFHEAFGDCMSVLHLMHLDPVLTRMAKEVEAGNVSTVVSQVGEELGMALGFTASLRDAAKPFHYVPPMSLAKDAAPDQLSREPHSFSRVFSTAFYAAIIAVSVKIRQEGRNTKDALSIARDILGDALFKAVKMAPAKPQFFASVAESILTVMAGLPYCSETGAVLLTWGLSTMKAASVEATKTGIIGWVLADKMVTSMENNPLYYCRVDVPCEIAALSGVVIGEEDFLSELHGALDYIWEQDLVTLKDGVFKSRHVYEVSEIDGENVLLRVSYNCDGCFNNASNPSAPEFGKRWKPENNSGCCQGGCRKKPEVMTQRLKLGCFVSERVCGSRAVRSCQVVRKQKVC